MSFPYPQAENVILRKKLKYELKHYKYSQFHFKEPVLEDFE